MHKLRLSLPAWLASTFAFTLAFPFLIWVYRMGGNFWHLFPEPFVNFLYNAAYIELGPSTYFVNWLLFVILFGIPITLVGFGERLLLNRIRRTDYLACALLCGFCAPLALLIGFALESIVGYSAIHGDWLSLWLRTTVPAICWLAPFGVAQGLIYRAIAGVTPSGAAEPAATPATASVDTSSGIPRLKLSLPAFCAATAVLALAFPEVIALYRLGADLSWLGAPAAASVRNASQIRAGVGIYPEAWLAGFVVFALPAAALGLVQRKVLRAWRRADPLACALLCGLCAPLPFLAPGVLVFMTLGVHWIVPALLAVVSTACWLAPFGLLQGLTYRAIAGVEFVAATATERDAPAPLTAPQLSTP